MGERLGSRRIDGVGGRDPLRWRCRLGPEVGVGVTTTLFMRVDDGVEEAVGRSTSIGEAEVCCCCCRWLSSSSSFSFLSFSSFSRAAAIRHFTRFPARRDLFCRFGGGASS